MHANAGHKWFCHVIHFSFLIFYYVRLKPASYLFLLTSKEKGNRKRKTIKLSFLLFRLTGASRFKFNARPNSGQALQTMG